MFDDASRRRFYLRPEVEIGDDPPATPENIPNDEKSPTSNGEIEGRKLGQQETNPNEREDVLRTDPLVDDFTLWGHTVCSPLDTGLESFLLYLEASLLWVGLVEFAYSGLRRKENPSRKTQNT